LSVLKYNNNTTIGWPRTQRGPTTLVYGSFCKNVNTLLQQKMRSKKMIHKRFLNPNKAIISECVIEIITQ